jgi:hypothetical protein
MKKITFKSSSIISNEKISKAKVTCCTKVLDDEKIAIRLSKTVTASPTNATSSIGLDF